MTTTTIAEAKSIINKISFTDQNPNKNKADIRINPKVLHHMFRPESDRVTLTGLLNLPTHHSHPARCWNDNRVSYLATNECMHVDTFSSSSSHLVFCLHLESSPYVCTSLLSSLDIHIWIPWRLLVVPLTAVEPPSKATHTTFSFVFVDEPTFLIKYQQQRISWKLDCYKALYRN